MIVPFSSSFRSTPSTPLSTGSPAVTRSTVRPPRQVWIKGKTIPVRVSDTLPRFFGWSEWKKKPGTPLSTRHHTKIVLDRSLTRDELLATLLHECLHVQNPSYRESTVQAIEKAVVSILLSNPSIFRRLLPRERRSRRTPVSDR